jgi:hypothetical protein
MVYTPLRTQYPFSDVNVRWKSRGEILRLEEQWNTFERVENYNDIIYQKFEKGLRSEMYYQFVNDQEFKNYRAGQQLHVVTYPSLPPQTFAPIRDRPMPDVPIVGTLPYTTNVPRFAINTITPSAAEQAAATADLAVYSFVSTFNQRHVLKYSFVSDEEKNAYERAELRVNASTS